MALNYYLDTEFLEGPQKKRVLGIPYGKTKNTIDLISIGIVCEDGREYYAISKDFNLKEAWNRYDLKELKGLHPSYNSLGLINGFYKYEKEYWIRENVLKPIFHDLIEKQYEEINKQKRIIGFSEKVNRSFTYKNFKKLLNKFGKPNSQIASEIVGFCYEMDGPVYYLNDHPDSVVPKNIKFHAYYADYDWVVFCWLFGRMIDLPKGFPMYCVDIKQIMDQKIVADKEVIDYIETKKEVDGVYPKLAHLEEIFKLTLKQIKNDPNYPVNKKPHHALSDAKFDRDLHNFLNQL